MRWDYESNMINNDFETRRSWSPRCSSAGRTYGAPVGGQTTWCLTDFLDLDRYTNDGDDRDAYYGMVQPRLGFSWDIRGNGRTVVFGGWGSTTTGSCSTTSSTSSSGRAGRSTPSASRTTAAAPGLPGAAAPLETRLPVARGLDDLIASGQAPGPEVFLVANDLKPPRSNQYTLGVRQQLGNWLGRLAYAGVRGFNGMSCFFGDLPPGTAFGDRFGGNVGVPGYARIFITSTARRTWYDALFLTPDKPLTVDSRWGFNLAYTYAEAEQTGPDNASEGVPSAPSTS